MGTNAAYVESVSAISNFNGRPPVSGEMVIDTGWGNFSSAQFPLTEYDIQLDTESSNPGEQIFEKLVAWKYLGEIVRRLHPDMASMHQDTSENREIIGEKLNAVFKITDSTPMVREIVADVCAGVLLKMNFVLV